MQLLEMPGEGCSSPATCCPAAKGQSNRVTLGWRIKAASPEQPGIVLTFLLQQRENNMWWSSLAPGQTMGMRAGAHVVLPAPAHRMEDTKWDPD